MAEIEYLGPLEQTPSNTEKDNIEYLGPLDQNARPNIHIFPGQETEQPAQIIKQDYPIRRQIMDVARPVLEGTGLGIGGVLGTGVGPLGTVAGAGLGYGAGRTLSDVLENMMGIRTPTPYGASALGVLDKASRDVATGSAMEMGGQVAGKLTGALLHEMSPLSPNAKQVANIANREGVSLSPADLRQERGESLLETGLLNAPFSATRSQKAKLKTIQDLTNWRSRILSTGDTDLADKVGLRVKDELDKFVEGVGVARQEGLDNIKNEVLKQLGSNETYQSLANSTKDLLAKRSMEAVKQKNALYNEALSGVSPESFNTNNLSATSDKILQEVGALPNPDPKLINILRWGSSTQREIDPGIVQALNDARFASQPPAIQQQLLNQYGLKIDDLSGQLMPKQKDIPTLLSFRQELNNLVKQHDQGLQTGSPHLRGQLDATGYRLNQLKTAVDSDLEAMAKDTGGETWNLYQAANKFYGEEYAPIWKNKTIQKMASTQPNDLLKVAFRPNNVDEILKVRKALGEDGFDKLKQKFTQQVFDSSGDFVGIEKELGKYGESINAIYSPAEIKLIKDAYTNGIRLEGSQLVDKKLLGVVKGLDRRPDLVTQFIARPNNTETIRRTMPFLSKETREEVEYKFLEQLMKTQKPNPGSVAYTSGGKEQGFISPIQFENAYNKYGDDTVKAMLSPQNYQKVKDLLSVSRYANAAERIAGNPSGTAQNVISWSTFAMFVSDPYKGIPIAIAPNIFARFYFSDAGRKLFIKGIKTPALTPEGIGVATRVIEVLNKAKEKDSQFQEINQ